MVLSSVCDSEGYKYETVMMDGLSVHIIYSADAGKEARENVSCMCSQTCESCIYFLLSTIPLKCFLFAWRFGDITGGFVALTNACSNHFYVVSLDFITNNCQKTAFYYFKKSMLVMGNFLF